MSGPRCPYCGGKMDEDGCSYGWYYVCQRCNAQSPCCETREEARAAAMREILSSCTKKAPHMTI